jgi:hypothetical protein
MWREGCDMTEADGKHWNEERDQPDEETMNQENDH